MSIHLILATLAFGAVQDPENPLNIPPPSAADMQRCAPPGVTAQTPVSTIPRARLMEGLHCIQVLIARQINSVAPLTVDEVTTLVSADAVGPTLQYHYRLDTDAARFTAAMRDGLSASTRSAACAASLRRSIALGASYRYIWTDRQGRPVHQLLIERCP